MGSPARVAGSPDGADDGRSGRSNSEFASVGLLLTAVSAGATGLVGLVRAAWAQGGSVPVTLAEGFRPWPVDDLPAHTSVTTLAETVEISVDALPLGLRLLATGEPAVLLLAVAAGA